jgi:hypothetical protein
MGIGLRFGVGPLRVYVPLTSSHKRKRRRGSPSRKSKAVYRGAPVRAPAFHGTVPMPDGSVYKCHHSHRTERAAIECAQKYIRTNFPQAHSPQAPRRTAPVPRNNVAAEVPKPPKWWPRAGWGTVRGYRIARKGNGRADLRFYFVPDDGSQPRIIELSDVVPLKEMGEYARGIMRGNNFTVKASAETMAQTKQTFQNINRMNLSERKKMFAVDNDLSGDAGWAWTPEYKLVPVAPGLVS